MWLVWQLSRKNLIWGHYDILVLKVKKFYWTMIMSVLYKDITSCDANLKLDWLHVIRIGLAAYSTSLGTATVQCPKSRYVYETSRKRGKYTSASTVLISSNVPRRCTSTTNSHLLEHSPIHHQSIRTPKWCMSIICWTWDTIIYFFRTTNFFLMYLAFIVVGLPTKTRRHLMGKHQRKARSTSSTYNLLRNGNDMKDACVVCKLFTFFSYVVSVVAPRQRLNYDKQKDSDGLALAQ